MSGLLELAPYAARDDARLLDDLVELSRHHLAGCAAYRAMWPDWSGAATVAELPFVHVGVFKHLELRTEAAGVEHQRTLESSSTTGARASRIVLDAESSELQARSSRAILADFVGEAQRPLLVLDSVASLRRRGAVSARVAAAMSLQPFASDMRFLLGDAADPASLKWEAVEEVASEHEALLVYGFTWILWLAWGAARMPESVRNALAGKTIHFVHSGGWKKLEEARVGREELERALLAGLAPASRVVDYYGLVEQVGVVYPLCEHGFRHPPVWADALVRDPRTLEPLDGEPGPLQLVHTLARGAPYHSVLTEDLARMVPGACPCGRGARRFELLGRLPKVEVRGCANV